MTKTGKTRVRMDLLGLQPRLIWANEREVEPRFLETVATGSPKETVVWFLETGEVEVSYARATVRAKAGQWIFLRAEDGRQRFTAGSRVISLRFHLRLRGGKPLFVRSRDLVLEGRRCARLEDTARALVAELERVDEPGTMLVARERFRLMNNFRIEAAFMSWLGAYVEAMELAGETAEMATERDVRVTKALVLIEDHRMRDKFSEAELARSCGLSVNQLGRLFRRERGMSPFQYYETRRLELARHALAESALPVKEIGFELGFSSPPHFSNWFAQHTKTGPRDYRVQNRTVARRKA